MVALLSVAIGLVGCSSGGGSDRPLETSGSVGPSPSAESYAKLVEQPFGSLYRSQLNNERVIHDAIQLETQKCMKAKGFSYTPGPFVRDELPLPRIGDVEYAKREGFGIVSDFRKPRKPRPLGKDLAGMSDAEVAAFKEALGGKDILPGSENDPDVVSVPVAGGGFIRARRSACINAAKDAVSGDLEQWMALSSALEDLANQVAEDVAKDPRVVEANRKWASCMQDAGFGSLSELDHIRAIDDKLDKKPSDLDELQREEIAVAVASAQCEQDVDMVAVTRVVQADVEKRLLEQNQGLITRWAEMNKTAAEKAKKILGK